MFWYLLGDGSISFEELESIVRPQSALTMQEKVQRAFDVIDTDKNGLIGCEELHNAFHQLGEEITLPEITKLIRVFDWDCDGFIDVLGIHLRILLHLPNNNDLLLNCFAEDTKSLLYLESVGIFS